MPFSCPKATVVPLWIVIKLTIVKLLFDNR